VQDLLNQAHTFQTVDGHAASAGALVLGSFELADAVNNDARRPNQ
jgi:hypothetical protein